MSLGGRFARALPVTFVLASAAIVVVRGGGSRDAVAGPPRSVTSLATSSATGAVPTASARGEVDEVVYRFVERAGEATFDPPAPLTASAQAALAAHWRKMPVPWLGLTGDAAAHTRSLALLTSTEETQWSMPKADGSPWTPDARVWNMNEGSFDQREALVAPVPTTATYRLRVPAAARLTFAPGVLGKAGARFRVVVAVDREETVLFDDAIARGPTWRDAVVDLAPFAGRDVALRFETRAQGAHDEGAPPTSIALWGNPTLLARARPKLPYNVLWIVVDALRPDVVASFHDDAADAHARAARVPPLEALLPKVPGLMPNLDALAARGVRFLHAYSAGAWTRPGTLSMLAGARSTELGVNPLPWVIDEAEGARFYGSRPPLLPLLLRGAGAATRAFVNNYFMVGYAAVGVDTGFERVSDHRYRTKDTLEVTREATEWLRAHASERFFLFCNYNSPHEPWEPPARFLARVPPPPEGPRDDIARRYMAEAAKDDDAIGVLLEALAASGHADDTLVVVSADHGETLSEAHAGTSKLDHMKVRYHHAVSNYEETTRIPILLALPGVLDGGRAVTARVRSTDLAPTVLDLEGLEPNARMSGRSLLGLVRGEAEEPRVVVSEGRGTRAVLAGSYRLLVREGAARTTTTDDGQETVAAEELYDLDADPGERRNLAPEMPEKVKEMRARLAAALANVPAADAAEASAAPKAAAGARVKFRFAGGGGAHRVSGTITVPASATLRATPVGIAPEALRNVGATLEVALTTAADAIVGLDAEVSPADAPITWTFYEDDRAWPPGAVFAGPYGVRAQRSADGIAGAEARAEAAGLRVPFVDARRDHGLFVVRVGERGESGGGGEGATPPAGAPLEGGRAEEMDRLLREWGYAHASGPAKGKAGSPVGPRK